MKFAPICLSKRHYCTIIAIISFLPGLLAAQSDSSTRDPFTLKAAVEIGLSSNPALAEFRERYNAAGQRIPQAAALPDPRLQVTHFFESVQTRTGPQENVIALSQGIPWPGTLRNRKEVASAEAEAIWHLYQATQLNLVRRIAEVYFDYAYLHKAVEISGQNVLLLEKLLPIVEEKVRVGSDLSSLLRLKVEVGQAMDQRDSLTERLEVAKTQLQLLLASKLPLPPPSWSEPVEQDWAEEALFSKLERTNPELRVNELRIQSAEAARELARLQARPDLSLGINYIQIGDAVSQSVAGSGKDPWGVTFSVSLPLNFKKNQAAQVEAASRVRASEAKQSDTLNQLSSQLNTSLISYRDALRRNSLYREELIPLAEQAFEISQTSYENGKSSILDVIESERSLLKLRLEYWRTSADLWQQQMVIETLTNAETFNTP